MAAASMYRDEFEERMRNMVGYIKTSIDTAKFDINANTDSKFASLVKHYDREMEKVKRDIEKLDSKMTTLDRKLDAVLKALKVVIEDV